MQRLHTFPNRYIRCLKEPIILETNSLVLNIVTSKTLTCISENTGYRRGLELKKQGKEDGEN